MRRQHKEGGGRRLGKDPESARRENNLKIRAEGKLRRPLFFSNRPFFGQSLRHGTRAQVWRRMRNSAAARQEGRRTAEGARGVCL